MYEPVVVGSSLLQRSVELCLRPKSSNKVSYKGTQFQINKVWKKTYSFESDRFLFYLVAISIIFYEESFQVIYCSLLMH